ncbi:MAG: DNA polymerase III subunit alpha [Minisyncoccales bacterium]
MKFSHLHVHSHYSLLDGLAQIDPLLDKVKALGMDSVAITDHGNMYGAVEFYKKAKARGIKPIIGCEVYVASESRGQKRPGIDDVRYHLVLLAKNDLGYRNLVKLVTKSHLEGFYYKPRVDEELLAQYGQGLIAMTACVQGKIPRQIIAKKMDDALATALRYESFFGKGNFFLELQYHKNIPEQETANAGLIEISKKTGICLVATNDCHYLDAADAEAQDILMLINTGADINDENRLTMKHEDFSMKSVEQMAEEFKNHPEALENTQKIVDLCEFEFELKKTKLPRFTPPEGETTEQYLRRLCVGGLKQRFGENPSKEVIDRFEYEFNVIKQLGYIEYFLIVQDFVNWAKNNRIVVGPGRGSAAGSLVSYLLNITELDPLQYGLLFERFLNPGRSAVSLPDIDMDFADRRRPEVIDYVGQKYGRDHVAQIITFGTMAARAVVRDVGRVLQYPYSYCDKMAKMIPLGMDLKESLEKADDLKMLVASDEKARHLMGFAKKLEGCARHASTHACGVVISPIALDEIVPVQHPTADDNGLVSQYELHAIEDMGLLKMDFLGLKNLTIIEDTLSRIYIVHKTNLELKSIPMDDRDSYALMARGDTVGVFQLESAGMQRYLKQLKPTQFEDIIAMVALYRPGPMQFIPQFIEGKNGLSIPSYLHPKLESILGPTYGIILYQEQTMKIAQELAGFSMAEADSLRKAIGKKIKELMMSSKQKFIDGCQKNNISKKIAQEIWSWIEPSADYSFNKSHAACYAMVAYQTAYLKAHYPVEFMAALITSEKNDVERVGYLIGECKNMGIEVLAPDINESFYGFTVIPGAGKIRFGLSAIKNVGENIVTEIVGNRKANGQFSDIFDFVKRINPKLINRKSLEALIKAGAFDNMSERNTLLFNIEKLLEIGRENEKSKSNGQRDLFGGMGGGQSKTASYSLAAAKIATDAEKLGWEKELLGLFVTSHPLESKEYREKMDNKCLKITRVKENPAARLVKIGGMISTVKKIITKTGKPMLFMNLEDLTDKIEVVVFASAMEKNPAAFAESKVVFVYGRVDNRDGETKIVADTVEEVLLA